MADTGFTHERPSRGATDVWLTPKSIIDILGPFDLDPCAATDAPWPTAASMIVDAVNGLNHSWRGLVWCNPPYSDVWTWMSRLADHGSGIGLIFARTETAGFHKTVWQRADAIAFPKRRIRFCLPDGTPGRTHAGAPSCFVAYGDEAVNRIEKLSDVAIVYLKDARRG